MRLAGGGMRLGVLLVVAGVLLVVVGSGAFTTVDAVRPADVVVVADAAGAYLQLAPHSGPNGAFAQDTDQDGTLDLELDGDARAVLGGGPNAEAVTTLTGVFNVTNLGTQSAAIWISDDATGVTFTTTDDAHGSLEAPETPFVLRPGETVQVDLLIETTGAGPNTALLRRATIHADTPTEGQQ